MSSHSSSKNRFNSHRYVMMTQVLSWTHPFGMSWTCQFTDTDTSVHTLWTFKVFRSHHREHCADSKNYTYTDSRAAFINQSRVLSYANTIAQSPNQAWGYWLLTCIAHTFLPSFLFWDMLCHSRGLNILLDSTLQSLWGMVLNISHSHNAPFLLFYRLPEPCHCPSAAHSSALTTACV